MNSLLCNPYFVKKLKDKVNNRRKLDGLELYTTGQIKNILKYKEIGKYEIVWTRDNKIADLNQLPDEYNVTQENGRYRIRDKNSFNNDFILNLSSSEYIEFSLQELREIKLNRILSKS
jgi:restriction endonuclease S subunit